MNLKYCTLFILTLLLSSCGGIKFLSKNSNTPEKIAFVDFITNNRLEYETIEVKFSAKLTQNNKSIGFNGLIRGKNNEILWTSATAIFGIEAARAYLTKDTVKVLNRLKSEYYIGSYQVLKKNKINLEFQDIQNILQNRIIYAENEKNNANNFVILQNEDNIIQYVNIGDKELKKQLKKGLQPTIQKIKFDLQKQEVIQNNIYDYATDVTITINYEKYQLIDGKKYPEKLIIKAIDKKQTVKIELAIKKVEINKKLKYPFKINSNYKIIRL